MQANVDDEVVPSIEQLLAASDERLLNTKDDVTAVQNEVDDLKCTFAQSEVATARRGGHGVFSLPSFSFYPFPFSPFIVFHSSIVSIAAVILGMSKENPGLTCGHIFAAQGNQNVYGDGTSPALVLSLLHLSVGNEMQGTNPPDSSHNNTHRALLARSQWWESNRCFSGAVPPVSRRKDSHLTQ